MIVYRIVYDCVSGSHPVSAPAVTMRESPSAGSASSRSGLGGGGMAIQRQKGLADDVYEAVFNKLMTLDIAPGGRITVDGLVRELEVSHTPIR
jgi:hypothetical protein